MLKLKLQYFGHLMSRQSGHWKRSWCWERSKAGGEGDNRGWDGWMTSLTRWTWVGDGQQSLACCSPWCCKESDTTRRLELNEIDIFSYTCVHAKSLQSCLIVYDAIHCSPLGPTVHGFLQARILEWVAMPSSRGSSWLRDQNCISYVSCIGRQVLYH